MTKFFNWCKSEIVLVVAMVLAIASSLFVHPDKAYIAYIDFRTLAILFCLMAVMAGFQKLGLFGFVAGKLLGKVKNTRGVIFILVMLSFFFSMLITNDVALITFVPFSFIVLKLILGKESEKQVVPVVVMQTIAANLGSMLTPIGNPQNLYLYGKTSLRFVGFMRLMLPYTFIAFVLLSIWCLLSVQKKQTGKDIQLEQKPMEPNSKKYLFLYGILFLLCILTVAHFIPYGITFAIVLIMVFLLDKTVLCKVDYALLLTFVGFFVFIGNMGRIPAFYNLLQSIIDGNEILTSVVASQFMSNVPAALLLSGFTDKLELLIVGTNLGGLGTLIASMASLISFKYIGKEYGHLKGKYLMYFTLANLLFLGILLVYVFI